jgi:hypothetical protein
MLLLEPRKFLLAFCVYITRRGNIEPTKITMRRSFQGCLRNMKGVQERPWRFMKEYTCLAWDDQAPRIHQAPD